MAKGEPAKAGFQTLPKGSCLLVNGMTTAPNSLYTIETLEIEKPDRSSSKNEVERVDDTEAARQTFQSGFSEPLQQKIEAVKRGMTL